MAKYKVVQKSNGKYYTQEFDESGNLTEESPYGAERNATRAELAFWKELCQLRGVEIDGVTPRDDQPPVDADENALEVLGLDVRTVNSLRGNGINSIPDLEGTSLRALMDLNGIGRPTAEKIYEALVDAGVDVVDTDDEHDE